MAKVSESTTLFIEDANSLLDAATSALKHSWNDETQARVECTITRVGVYKFEADLEFSSESSDMDIIICCIMQTVSPSSYLAFVHTETRSANRG